MEKYEEQLGRYEKMWERGLSQGSWENGELQEKWSQIKRNKG